MSEIVTKDFEFELSQRPIDILKKLDIAKGEKTDIEGIGIKEPEESYKIIVGQGIFLADADTIRIYTGGKVKRAPEAESPEEKTRALEAEVKWLRELLNDKSCGVGLMRVSLIWGVTFFLFFLIGAYTPLVLVHPVISILGLIGSLGFFCIGWINSKG